MSHRTRTAVLGGALAVSIGLNIAVRLLPKTRPNFEYFPNMARSVRFNAFEANPNFADGMTLRAPVPGTIPRGQAPPGEAPLENPFSAADRDALARGAVVFANFCQPCHGSDGQGGGLVVMHGFPAPPTLLRAQILRRSDAQLFGVVTNGSGAMPSYASQLSRDDRWKAILYVRSLRRPSQSGAGQ